MARFLALQGASADDAARTRDALRHHASRLHTSWSLRDSGDADVTIIDIDSVYGHMDWLRAQTSGRTVAALTQNPRFEDAEMILHKPLNTDELIALLNAVDARTPQHVVTETVAAEIEEPIVAAEAPVAAPVVAPPPTVIEVTPTPPVERRLADWLADGALAQAMRLAVEGAPELTLDPGNKTYYADGPGRSLTPYFKRVIELSDWQPVEYQELASLQQSSTGQPYARLLWLYFALGSNGRLAPELDREAKYKLSRWPQIEREFPKHFRIATVMMKQPATLTDIAEQSGASIADVIDFTNAYNATGHIEMEPIVAAPAARDTGRGAILSRLRNPFGAS